MNVAGRKIGPMPSFRVQFQVSGLRPGHRPDEVLEVARAAVVAPLHCDDVRLDMPAGVPTVTVRFTIAGSHDAAEDARARRHGAQITQQVSQVAVVSPPRVLRRRGGSWLPIPAL